MGTTTDTNNKLLDQIAKAPDDVASYLVYADALSAKNDPRGELIVLMQQMLERPADAHLGAALDTHLTKHKAKLFGSLGRHTGITWDLHLGFLRSVRYMPDTSDDVTKVVREILSLPIACVLRDLLVFASYDWEIANAKKGATKHPATMEAGGVRFAKKYTSVDDALAKQKEALWLEVDVDTAQFPAAIAQLTNLEWLEVRGSVTELPKSLAKLTHLRRLDIDWCYALTRFPEEIFGIETLGYMSMYDCRELGPAYHMGRVNNLLGGFTRAKTPSRRRILEANLMLGRLDRALELAKPGDLLAALDSNVGVVRDEALKGLLRALPAPFGKTEEKSAFDGSGVAIIGSMNFDKKQLAEKLTARGATKVTTKIEPATTHVILGTQPAGKQALIEKRTIVLEAHLLPLLAAKVDAKKTNGASVASTPAKGKKSSAAKKGAAASASSSMSTDDLLRDLSTRDEAKVMRAVTALKDLGVPKELFVHLVVVAQDVALKKSRDEAKKLLAIHAPASVTDAMKTHLKSSLLLESLGETKRAERIILFCNDAKVIDPLALAEILASRARVSLKYLFENAPSEQIVRVLEAMVKRKDQEKDNLSSLDLHTLELSQIPKEVAKLKDVEALDLCGNHLSSWPDVVLEMKSLSRLDLSNNYMPRVPETAAKMTKLTALDLSGCKIRKFPMAVLGMTSLEELDVGNSQQYVQNEARIKGIPDEIRALTKLRVLGYDFNLLDPFPEAIFELKNLETLSLVQADLPKEIPEGLKKLTKLRKMTLGYSSLWESKKAALTKLLPKCKFER